MKKITNNKDTIMWLEIEKLRVEREKARLFLDKSFILYFAFLIVGIIGFVYDYIGSSLLNVFVIVGLLVLIIGTLPYLLFVIKEEKKINESLSNLKRRR